MNNLSYIFQCRYIYASFIIQASAASETYLNTIKNSRTDVSVYSLSFPPGRSVFLWNVSLQYEFPWSFPLLDSQGGPGQTVT